MNKHIKVGGEFKLMNKEPYVIIIIDSIINGIVGHHIKGGKYLTDLNCMTCKTEKFDACLITGILEVNHG